MSNKQLVEWSFFVVAYCLVMMVWHLFDDFRLTRMMVLYIALTLFSVCLLNISLWLYLYKG